MATFKPDPSFYPSPESAIAGPAEELAYVVTLNTGPATASPTRWTSSTSTHADQLRPAGRPPRHAQRRRRAAPLRLERVLVGAVPVGAAPARRAPLPARAGPALVAHPRRRRQGRPGQPEARQGHRARRAGARRPATRARTRRHCGPDGLYCSRARRARRRRPGRRLPARPRDLRPSRASGRSTAARRSWPTTSGGTSATTRLLTSEWGTPNMVEDGVNAGAAARRQVRPPAPHLGPARTAATTRRSTSAPSSRWCSSCARRTTRASRTASSAWSSRPRT